MTSHLRHYRLGTDPVTGADAYELEITIGRVGQIQRVSEPIAEIIHCTGVAVEPTTVRMCPVRVNALEEVDYRWPCGPVSDVFMAVPEPSVVLMLGVGILGLWLLRKRGES